MTILARFVDPYSLDVVLAVIKIFYAVLLILLVRRAPDSLSTVRLGWLSNTTKALWATVGILLLSVLIDLIIAIDFAVTGGQFAGSVVSWINLLVLVCLAWLVVVAGRSRSLDTENTAAEPNAGTASTETTQAIDHASIDDLHSVNVDTDTQVESEDTAKVYQQLEQLLSDTQLFKEPELNLQRLARKLGVPARKVSRAVNEHAGVNISQWVNQARINAACEMLQDQSASVQQAMMDSGFTTKSNFNREFRRVKGCSPTQWRNEHHT